MLGLTEDAVTFTSVAFAHPSEFSITKRKEPFSPGFKTPSSSLIEEIENEEAVSFGSNPDPIEL